MSSYTNMVKVKLLKKCWCGKSGDTKQMHRTQAEQLIKDRFAVEIQEDNEARESRAKESQAMQNKALKEKAKREKKEADKQAKVRSPKTKPENKSMSAAS